jgi:hypothetical protein
MIINWSMVSETVVRPLLTSTDERRGGGGGPDTSYRGPNMLRMFLSLLLFVDCTH